MRPILSALAAGVVAGLMATACGGSEKLATDPAASVGCVLNGLSVSPSTATLHPGDSLRVVLNYTPCFGEPTTIAVRWRSSNISIATVGDTSGLVRAYSRGQATIIATAVADPTVQSAMLLVVQ